MSFLACLAAVVVCNGVPSRFVHEVTNPWYPLPRGSTAVFRGPGVREVVRVARATKTILGVPCTSVRDDVYTAGRLSERTTDWYAQDSRGNVWYFGEKTAEIGRGGAVTSTEGSWTAGVDGARPGIVMPAHPRAGESFRQEHYKGHAEDHFAIVSLSAQVSTPYVTAEHALETREWSPLEPHVVEHKLYVRGVGLVWAPADHLKLVSYTR